MRQGESPERSSSQKLEKGGRRASEKERQPRSKGRTVIDRFLQRRTKSKGERTSSSFGQTGGRQEGEESGSFRDSGEGNLSKTVLRRKRTRDWLVGRRIRKRTVSNIQGRRGPIYRNQVEEGESRKELARPEKN